MSSSPVKLIIFDKDGTLIDFHRMWLPGWASALTGGLGDQLGGLLARIASSGALNQENLLLLRADLSQALHRRLGLPQEEAFKIVAYLIPESGKGTAHPVCNLRKLLLDLQSMGVRSALCTADAREPSLKQMKELGILDLLDDVVAGDDEGMIQKPDPLGAKIICKRLGIKLESRKVQETIVVGDTVADVKMGKLAGLKASVAVLSGVGTRETMAEYTDHFLKNVNELPKLIANLNGISRELPTILQRKREALERKQIFEEQLAEDNKNKENELLIAERKLIEMRERLPDDHFFQYRANLLKTMENIRINWSFLEKLRKTIEEELELEDITRNLEDMELEKLEGDERNRRQQVMEEERNQRLITINGNWIERERRRKEAIEESK